MEHRWGRRISARIPVRLSTEAGEHILGRTENISVSGAYVQTTSAVPLWARVEVEIVLAGQPGATTERMAAHVTRRTRDGAALEWCELAPRAVRTLLLARDPLAQRRAVIDVPPQGRQEFERQSGVKATAMLLHRGAGCRPA